MKKPEYTHNISMNPPAANHVPNAGASVHGAGLRYVHLTPLVQLVARNECPASELVHYMHQYADKTFVVFDTVVRSDEQLCILLDCLYDDTIGGWAPVLVRCSTCTYATKHHYLPTAIALWAPNYDKYYAFMMGNLDIESFRYGIDDTRLINCLKYGNFNVSLDIISHYFTIGKISYRVYSEYLALVRKRGGEPDSEPDRALPVARYQLYDTKLLCSHSYTESYKHEVYPSAYLHMVGHIDKSGNICYNSISNSSDAQAPDDTDAKVPKLDSELQLCDIDIHRDWNAYIDIFEPRLDQPLQKLFGAPLLGAVIDIPLEKTYAQYLLFGKIIARLSHVKKYRAAVVPAIRDSAYRVIYCPQRFMKYVLMYTVDVPVEDILAQIAERDPRYIDMFGIRKPSHLVKVINYYLA